MRTPSNIGAISSPPAVNSGHNVLNNTGVDCLVVILTGTVTALTVNGQALSVGSGPPYGPYYVASFDKINQTGGATWSWYGV